MSDEEIYTKDEHYQDWKSDNIGWLKDEFLSEDVIKELQGNNWTFGENRDIILWIKKAINKTHNKLSSLDYFEEKSDDFEAYCKQEYNDRDGK